MGDAPHWELLVSRCPLQGKAQVPVMGMGEVKPLLSPGASLLPRLVQRKSVSGWSFPGCAQERADVCAQWSAWFLEGNTEPVLWDSEVPHFEKSDTILNMSVPAFHKVPAARQCHCPRGEVLALRALGDLLWQCPQHPAPSVWHMEGGHIHPSHFADGKWHLRFFAHLWLMNQARCRNSARFQWHSE